MFDYEELSEPNAKIAGTNKLGKPASKRGRPTAKKAREEVINSSDTESSLGSAVENVKY